jgi:hypothetical protein
LTKKDREIQIQILPKPAPFQGDQTFLKNKIVEELWKKMSVFE